MCVLCQQSNCVFTTSQDSTDPLNANLFTPPTADPDSAFVGVEADTAIGLLSGFSWYGPTELTYGFASGPEDYAPGQSENGETASFSPLSDAGQDIVRDAFAHWEAVIPISFVEVDGAEAQIAIGGSDVPPTAWAYLPTGAESGGDIWFGVDYNPLAPLTGAEQDYLGTYAHMVSMHEIGHALGLKHPHQQVPGGGQPINVPGIYDGVETTVMSYRSAPTGPIGAYSIEPGHYAQSLMMLDIAAIQSLYGADYTTHAEDTVYSFDPGSGTMWVNGVPEKTPTENVVFRTIWDGGGVDVIDLSAYTTDIYADLTPGGVIAFDRYGLEQRARLDDTYYAAGNLYMSLLYENDPRSLIENVVTGSGNDTVVGNDADNMFTFSAGRNTAYGNAGTDTAYITTDLADLGFFSVAGELLAVWGAGSVLLDGIEYVQTTTGTIAVDSLDIATFPEVLLVDTTPTTLSVLGAGSGATGTYDVTDQGNGLTLQGALTLAIGLPVTVQSNTILSFEFGMTGENEVVGIGLMTGDLVVSSSFFQLAGSEVWGLQTYAASYAPASGSASQRYDIDIGKEFAGTSFDSVVLFIDGQDPLDTEASFSNFSVREKSARGELAIGTALYTVQDGRVTNNDFGTYEISSDSSTITVSDNGWKVVEMPITITANTVLSFDFSSDHGGEIHGIGFASDDNLAENSFFQLAGSQEWGLQAHDDYDIGSGTRSYQILVGDFLAGQSFDRIVLAADDDHDASGESSFSNISFAESTPATELLISGTGHAVQDGQVKNNDYGTYSLSVDGTGITVTDNGWKVVEMPITITADTLLSFDFSSDTLGEIHGIGFASDDNLAGESFFQLSGTQTHFGIQDYNGIYDTGSGLQSYDIAVGNYLAGQSFDRILFVADDDRHANGDSTFHDINLTETLGDVIVPDTALFIGDTFHQVLDGRVRKNDYGTYVISDDNETITVTDNGWKVIEMPITITEDTVLSFDFSSDTLGEIHGIGFASDDNLAGESFFQLSGTQTHFGIQDYNGIYDTGSGLQSYDIAVGNYLAGQSFDRILFVADDDRHANGDSTFHDINLA